MMENEKIYASSDVTFDLYITMNLNLGNFMGEWTCTLKKSGKMCGHM